MNQFLYFLKPTRIGMVTDGPTAEEAETVSRHFSYLSDLTDKGVTITETNCPLVHVQSGI